MKLKPHNAAFFLVSKGSPRRAFTLVESLTVACLIGFLITLFLPTIRESTRHQIAIHQLSAIFEQTRMSALEKGCTTLIAFVDGASLPLNHPHRPSFAYKAYIVLWENEDGTTYTAATPWQFLPQGISFSSTGDNLVGDGLDAFNNRKLFSDLPQLGNRNLRYISFNSTGAIEAPTQNHLLRLSLYQGSYDPLLGQDMPQKRTTSLAGHERIFLETFTFSRFTGRTQIGISGPL